MTRFNTAAVGTKTINKAGGVAYSQSAELELVSLMLTSFAGAEFYRTSNETFVRVKELVAKCDKLFVAKAAVYARTVFGMRSISHVVASELASHIGGQAWAKNFYNKIIYRVDDMMEICSYHERNGKLSGAMKKGFASAIGRFDKYQLAKYRGEGKGVKLVDVVNMVHPRPTERNGDALDLLVNGKLVSFDTWEAEVSAAGNDLEKKKAAWAKLVDEKKLGYFALLRNLRNLILYADSRVDKVITQLTDVDAIKKSLVLPFRFITAFEEVQKMEPSTALKKVSIALQKAVEISLSNVPVFDGETLVVLDVSGSMAGKPALIGSLFASVLIKTNNADFMVFSDDANYVNVNAMDSVLTIAASIRFAAGGTNFPSIFQRANKKYDRVIILSDMQGWIGGHTPVREFNAWKVNTGSNPFVYSFDLENQGSMQFPEQNVYCVAGFSEKVFDIMAMLEKDKKALINEIKKVEI